MDQCDLWLLGDLLFVAIKTGGESIEVSLRLHPRTPYEHRVNKQI